MFWQENQDAESTANDAAQDAANGADATTTAGDQGVEIPTDWTDPEALTAFAVDLAWAIGQVVLILVIAWIVAGWVAARIRNRGEKSKRLDTTLSLFFSNMARWAILALGVITAIGILGIPTASFAALIAAAGLAVGLALQGSLGNFASGVMLLIFRPFKVGDYINAAGTAGTVKEIQLFATILDTPDNRRLIVPNGEVFGSTIENVSFHETRRVDVAVGTDYGADLDEVRAVLTRAAEALPQKLADKDVAIVLQELGDSSIGWSVRAWVNAADFWPAKDELTRLTKKHLDDAKIGIPFPQMDVHLDKVD
ncbi:MAG: mechanosensitive ion channel [bacterium]|nr:mechanosensitive ion channel [bacterium]